MRILFLTLYFAPDRAANAVLMTGLAQELAGLGHEVTVVCAVPHYDSNRIWPDYRGKVWSRARHGEIDVFRTYLYVPRSKSGFRGRLLNYASFNILSTILGALRRGHDMVFAPSPPLTIGLSAYLIGRLRNIPYVYNVQDIYPDIAVRLGALRNQRAIRLFRRLEQFVYAHATAVSVLSEGFRQNLMRKGVPEDKIAVIPNFVDVDFMRPLPKEESAFAVEHGLLEKFVVEYAGNVGLSQGLEVVIKAARELQAHPEIQFLIVGDGAAKDELRERARSAGVSNLSFLPFQPHSKLPQLYAAADLSLVTLRANIGSESVPSKTYTIMASSRPVLASVSEETETKHLVERAQCGLWVPPQDPHKLAGAVLRLYHDGELRERLGSNGREYVEIHHTPGVIARRYSTLLADVIDHAHATQEMKASV